MLNVADPHVMEADGGGCILSLLLVIVKERSVLTDEGIRDHERVIEALDLGEERSMWVLSFIVFLKGSDGRTSRLLRSFRRRCEVGGEEGCWPGSALLSRRSWGLVWSCWLGLVKEISR